MGTWQDGAELYIGLSAHVYPKLPHRALSIRQQVRWELGEFLQVFAVNIC